MSHSRPPRESAGGVSNTESQEKAAGKQPRTSPADEDAARYRGGEVPRMEPWLWVMLAAFLPVLAVGFIPRSFMVPMFVLTAVIMVVGVVMLGMHLRRDARRRRGERD